MRNFHDWFIANVGSYERCTWWLMFDFALLAVPGKVFAANDLGYLFISYNLNTLWGFCLLVGIAGMAGTAHRLTYEYRKNKVVARPGLFVMTNFFGSIASGMAAMLGAAALGVSNESTGIAVFLFAFTGSLAIERAWQALAKKWLPIDTIMAKDDAAAEPAATPKAALPLGNEGKFKDD